MWQISAYIVNTPTVFSKNMSMSDGILYVVKRIVIAFVANSNVLDGSRIDAAVLRSKRTVCGAIRAEDVLLDGLVEHQ
jgi:hypothetical protein